MRKEYTISKKGTYPIEEGEKWVEVNGTDGWYMISNHGRIWSYKRGRLVGAQSGNGYYYADINRKTYCVHRLVAEHFIPNPDNLPEVDHIDTNITNNVWTNLRWVDRGGNQRNPITIEKFKTSNKRKGNLAHLAKQKMVIRYTEEGETIYSSITEAANSTNICRSSISMACRGIQKTAGGYYWKYYKAVS